MPHFSRRPMDLRTRNRKANTDITTSVRSPWYKCRCNSRCIIEENIDTKDIDDGRGKDKETNQGEDASGGSE
jgi:hypothetical protein